MDTLLAIAADLFVAGFLGFSKRVYQWMAGDKAKAAFKQALANAIYLYAPDADPLLVQSLKSKSGLLTDKAVMDELGVLVSGHRDPNYILIADTWKKMIVNIPTSVNLEFEARRFASLFRSSLRATDVYRAVMESRDLEMIVDVTEELGESTSQLEANTRHLIQLLESNLVPLYHEFFQSHEHIRRAVLRDFQNYISTKTRSFVGREHIFRQLDEFLDHPDHRSGYFLLQGDPGIGKSAILAQLVVRRGYVHHFNIRSDVNTTREFLRNICAQLIAVYKLDYQSLPDSVAEDGAIFHNILFEVSEKVGHHHGRCVIVIDALDELDPAEAEHAGNPLYLPQTPPDGIFFVISRRRDSQPFIRVSDASSLSYTIQQDDDLDRADVKLYIEQQVGRRGIQQYIAAQDALSTAQFVDTLLAMSQSNFIYTRLILDDIDRGVYTERDFSKLPVGLINYYQDHWERMQLLGYQDWVQSKLPVILALTVAKEPITIEQISKYAGVEERAPTKRMIQTVLNDFDQFIYKRWTAEPQANSAMQGERQYRWYHASFFEFIEKKDEIEEGVSLIRARQRELQVMKMQMRESYGPNNS